VAIRVVLQQAGHLFIDIAGHDNDLAVGKAAARRTGEHRPGQAIGQHYIGEQNIELPQFFNDLERFGFAGRHADIEAKVLQCPNHRALDVDTVFHHQNIFLAGLVRRQGFGGNDTYIITDNQTGDARIFDLRGDNTIVLADGLNIVSGAMNATFQYEITLDNGAIIAIDNAEAYDFQVGNDGATIDFTGLEALLAYNPIEIQSDLLILGTDGDDNIVGSNDNNIINGLAGSDTISSGLGTDIPVFDGDWGADAVTDFEDGVDLLDFSDSGLAFGDLTITPGADTLIEDGLGNSITLTGFVGTLDENDFIF